MNEKNHREFSRFHSKLEADVQAEERAFPGTVRDLSMKGVSLACSEKPAPGTACRITIFLAGRSSEARIRAEGRVVRSDPSGIALDFDQILGVESYEHLQNLARFNLAPDEQTEREFDSHLGIKKKGEGKP